MKTFEEREKKVARVIELLGEMDFDVSWPGDEKMIRPLDLRVVFQIKFSNQTILTFTPSAFDVLSRGLVDFLTTKGGEV
jgi:hypothetical protein